jgi:hypothetical protein
MAQHQVRVVEHSVTPSGTNIITLQLRYWRAIHGEVMTHRVFSRNASSSRAIPVMKTIKQVWNAPACPAYWGANKPGMQAGDQLTGFKLWASKATWKLSSRIACVMAYGFVKVGLHKQVANRILEPYQFISVVLTGTSWHNFFELRRHPAAQPEFQDLANSIYTAIKESVPKAITNGQWHLPYTSQEERASLPIQTLLKLSTARCTRVSYNRHDGTPAPHHEDIRLHDDLVGSVPLHASPAEHQVMFSQSLLNSAKPNSLQGNFRGGGLIQYRKLLEKPELTTLYIKVRKA